MFYNISLDRNSYSTVVLPVSGSKILVLCAYTCNSAIAAKFVRPRTSVVLFLISYGRKCIKDKVDNPRKIA